MEKSFGVILENEEIKYGNIFFSMRKYNLNNKNAAELIINSGQENIYHFIDYGTVVNIHKGLTSDVIKKGILSFCKIWGTSETIEQTRKKLEEIIGECKLVGDDG